MTSGDRDGSTGDRTMQNRAVLGFLVLLFAITAVIAVAAERNDAEGRAASQAARAVSAGWAGM